MRITVVGMGKIGSVVFNMCLEAGHEVFGVDVLPPHSRDYLSVVSSDLVFVAVNTTSDRGYDTRNVSECLGEIRRKNKNVEVSVLSTCPPSFFPAEGVVYNPLFIRQGSIKEDIRNAEFVLLGGESNMTKEFYKSIMDRPNFIEVSQKEAAVIKMGINGFLCLKVVYANIIGDFCVGLGLNPDRVLEGIASCGSVNPRYFKYGSGYGGPCLPIDNSALASETGNDWFVRIDEENRKHLIFEFNQFKKTNPDKSLMYGFDDVSYKKGVPIIVASQRLALARMLAEDGYKITIRENASVCRMVESQIPNLFSYQEVSDS